MRIQLEAMKSRFTRAILEAKPNPSKDEKMRLYRDSRCGSLMPPWTAELVLDPIGRETLYEAGERDA